MGNQEGSDSSEIFQWKLAHSPLIFEAFSCRTYIICGVLDREAPANQERTVSPLSNADREGDAAFTCYRISGISFA